MKTELSVPTRLSALPALAALTVVLLSALTLIDFARSFTEADPAGVTVEPGGLAPEVRCREEDRSDSLSWDVPEYGEAEALGLLEGAPSRAVVASLWPYERHHERLFELLLEERTAPGIRLFLLGSFARDDRARALEAARGILKAREQRSETLFLAASDVLSRYGVPEDAELLCARPGESHQLKTLREEYRAALCERSP